MMRISRKVGLDRRLWLGVWITLLILPFGCGEDSAPVPEPEKVEVVRRNIIFPEPEKKAEGQEGVVSSHGIPDVSDMTEAMDDSDGVMLPAGTEADEGEEKAESLLPPDVVAAAEETAGTEEGVEAGLSVMPERQESGDLILEVEEIKTDDGAAEGSNESEGSIAEVVAEGFTPALFLQEGLLEGEGGFAIYDPSGRIDPFRPLIQERPQVRQREDRPERRVPQTPLEKVALSQLKLVGIVRSPMGSRAMVEESSGRGYVVTEGTYIGMNGGRVTAIERERIVVTEIVESLSGEFREEQRELKLQKPTGE
ncbi:pilus assembly protein PilP [Desulfobotulus sp. H1]|uniref:Pilus assembly protein PilP n=1 Tax=Desulfobotulus pelophilus TaxID=2823377 RepID=A0ABT3NBA5_9BACT|nr:pilus assembly protein PilP [Desulfobotulus pelophilus]MCW7754746.1 pilus assembly protein PilP [Desulfobotulus pelophilus]